MAAFREHVTFSAVLGVGYAAALKWWGIDTSHAVLAGGLCGVAGMLPDLDSDSGKPVRELFGLIATVGALILFHRLRNAALEAETRLLIAAGFYLTVRFGVSALFKRLTVHRGMCHSLPAALIAGSMVYLAYDDPHPLGQLTLAGGVCLGFLSHLVLDEIYAVDFRGLRPKFNQFAGSAIKLYSASKIATLTCWLILGMLGYRIGVREGYVRDVLPTWMAAAKDAQHAVVNQFSRAQR